MSSPLHRTAAALAAACALLPSASSAQRPAADSVTLLRAVLGGYVGSGPQLTVGSLAPEFPAALARAPGEAIGTVTFGGPMRGAMAVVALPSGPDSAVAELMRRLQGDGWTRPAPPPEFGGFVPTARLLPTFACRDSVALSLSASSRDGGGSVVRVMRTAARNSPCLRDAEMMSRFQPNGSFPIPALTPPAGARMIGGGGGRSSSSTSGIGMSAEDEQLTEERALSTLLLTTLSPDSVVAHYVAQLTAAGWTAGAAARGDGVATRVLATRDDRGRAVHGVLGAAVLPGAPERDVTFHVLRRTPAR